MSTTTNRLGTPPLALGVGLYLLAAIGLLGTLLFSAFPSPDEIDRIARVNEDGTPVPFPESIDLLLLIVVVGALGATLHALTSLVEFVGNDQFEPSWTMWYVVRPIVGSLLSVLFYFVSRGVSGVIAGADEFYTIVAVAGLVGMFSKQALYKLSELFDVLFKNSLEEKLDDKLVPHPKPGLDAADPAVLVVGATERTLTFRGSDFVPKKTVARLGDRDLDTTVVDPSTLTVVLSEDDVATAGDLVFTVFTPKPGGGPSRPFTVRVEDAPGGPPPEIPEAVLAREPDDPVEE